MIENINKFNLSLVAQNPDTRDMLCALLNSPYDWTHDAVWAGMKAHSKAKGESFGVVGKKMRELMGENFGLSLSSAFAHIGKNKTREALLKNTTSGQLYYKGDNPTVDLAIFNETGTHILMIQRGKPPCQGYWVLPGGFHDSNSPKGGFWQPGRESASDAACRELKEETGLDAEKTNLTFIQEYDDLLRDPRNNHESKITTHLFLATAPMNEIKPNDSQGEVQNVEWKKLDSLPELIGFDHRILIEKAKCIFSPETKINHDKIARHQMESMNDIVKVIQKRPKL